MYKADDSNETLWCSLCGTIGHLEGDLTVQEPAIIAKVRELMEAADYVLEHGMYSDGLDCIGKLSELKTMLGGKG